MSNQDNTNITWKCYPSNVEEFGDVNYPVIDQVMNQRKSFLQEIVSIDNLPNNNKVPDRVGPVSNFKGPSNEEPIKNPLNTSLDPVIVLNDSNPGIIMPGNLSFNLPNKKLHTPNKILLYPDMDIVQPQDKTYTLHGDDILQSPQVEMKETSYVTPKMLNVNDNVVETGVRPMSQQEFHMASVHNSPSYVSDIQNIPANDKVNLNMANDNVNNNLPNNNLLKDNQPKHIAVENYPDSANLPRIVVPTQKHQQNKLVHKLLMYVSIALVIYLVYVLLYEK
jgi:hypothetical protein